MFRSMLLLRAWHVRLGMPIAGIRPIYVSSVSAIHGWSDIACKLEWLS